MSAASRVKLRWRACSHPLFREVLVCLQSGLLVVEEAAARHIHAAASRHRPPFRTCPREGAPPFRAFPFFYQIKSITHLLAVERLAQI